jgi:hypothetical protein
MNHCLNRDELRKLIDFKVDDQIVEDESLKVLIENAIYWEDEIFGLNYFFSQILERKNKGGQDCLKLIEFFYALEDEMAFNIQEFDSTFIDYMLRNMRDQTLSLEDDLIRLQNNLSDYKYYGTLRY